MSMRNGLSTSGAHLEDSAAQAGRPYVSAAARGRDDGKTKVNSALLSIDRIRDELLFLLLFALAVASLLPSVLLWFAGSS